ncbi:TonB-dependent receptor plug domain-containing protein [Pseudobacteriovorax antillogorgiicola]|uniref:Outer membrane receptor proteins, mostly Fe transport n=1 Tax=Pseudobacteriovorax antillogorgiicola TaxID=1513793 RepID=A0A1Y6CDS4_9BACT|nr:TonB-dependent receptor plug domain-containing protein [Pseudobacteriovorax antillogorgiicola]TCS49360.1 outer membrane receptor protein involved in Fe transport [Pseudobacteriovorax antillogorgiicola]SMF47536.1 Outer membrane receptor proteins, mostly Fe transport [Pseudobacteriovorax antillogorgiicola]
MVVRTLVRYGIGLIVSIPSSATNAKPPEESAPRLEEPEFIEQLDPERLHVLGSRIKRIDQEQSSPLMVLDRDMLESSGVISLGEIFRKSALLSPRGNFSGDSTRIAAGASRLDILGLGASRTLVLLNGKRLPQVPGEESVNVDNIPLALVERVEILSGGASAVYGADAIAGVVNVVLKKDFTGTEVTGFLSQTEDGGGDELELALSQGLAWGGSSRLVLSLGIRRRSSISKRDRDLAFADDSRQYTVYNPPPGTWSYQPVIDGSEGLEYGNWQTSANCPNSNRVATVPSQPNDVYCAGLRRDIDIELIPEKDEKFLTAQFETSVSDSLSLRAWASYHDSQNQTEQGQFMVISEDPIYALPVLVSRERALEQSIITADQPGDYFYIYAPLTEEPERSYTNRSQRASLAVTLEGFYDDWEFNTTIGYQRFDGSREGKNIFANETIANLFYNESNSLGQDPLYNPLDPNRDSVAFLAAFRDLESSMESSASTWDFFAHSLFQSPWGQPLSVGAGAFFGIEGFRQTPDDNDKEFNTLDQPLYTGTFTEEGEGDRENQAVFAELLWGASQSIEVDSSFRWDRYSDIGSTFNYGMGSKWSVLPFLGIRARYGTSFRAPPLPFIHQKGVGQFITINDDYWCQVEQQNNRFCDPEAPSKTLKVNIPRNKNLKPETGRNYIAGLLVEPTKSIALLVDYYLLRLQDTYQQDSVQSIVNRWYEENPGSTDGGVIDENEILVDENGVISSISLPYRNLGERRVQAIAGRLTFEERWGPWGIRWLSDYFRTLSHKIRESDDGDLREQVGYYDFPAWRMNHRFTGNWGRHSLYLGVQVIAAQSQDPLLASDTSLGTSVGDYKEYDVSYRLEFPDSGHLQIGVNNLLNTIGGTNTAFSSIGEEDTISTSLYSYAGRSVFLRLTQRF